MKRLYSKLAKLVSFKTLADNAPFILAPLSLALYPILYLYSKNIQEVPFNLLVTPLLIVSSASIVITLLAKLLIKDTNKTAIIVILFWLSFFYYGVFFNNAGRVLAAGLISNKVLLPLWLLLWATAAIMVWRSKRITDQVLKVISVFGLTLLFIQMINITHYGAGQLKAQNSQFLLDNQVKTLRNTGHPLPNIYYIMVDSYPRTDTLKQFFGYDNSGFDNFLTSNGFFKISKSHSNYNQTSVSIPSMMNMSYINYPKVGKLPESAALELYKHNKVIAYLKSGGYKIVNNSNLYSTAFNDAADFNVDCAKNNEFMFELVNGTILKPFNIITNQTRKNKRADALCVMDNISGPGRPGPKFIFSHLLPPHPPYLFRANGEDANETNLGLTVADRWLVKKPYVAQLKYVNKRLAEAVKNILKQSTDPIIIIQSDHGTLSSATQATALDDKRPIVLMERSRNFVAIHLPKYCDRSPFYDTMTNVNTFLGVFNSCFNAGYKLLPDKIFYLNNFFLGYRDVTEIVNKAEVDKIMPDKNPCVSTIVFKELKKTQGFKICN